MNLPHLHISEMDAELIKVESNMKMQVICISFACALKIVTFLPKRNQPICISFAYYLPPQPLICIEWQQLFGVPLGGNKEERVEPTRGQPPPSEDAQHLKHPPSHLPQTKEAPPSPPLPHFRDFLLCPFYFLAGGGGALSI